MKSNRFALKSAILVLLALTLSSPVFAKDTVRANVTPLSGLTPVIEENGKAEGTIHVLYTWTGFSFPVNYQFASVTVDLDGEAGAGNATNYSGLKLLLSQKQNGAENLVVVPNPSQFDVTAPVGGVYWSDSSAVSVSTPSGALPSYDGATLVGVLQIETNPPNQLRTVTTILFKLMLVWPTACLKLYDFVTEEGFYAPLSTIVVNTKMNGGVEKVNTTEPGVLSNKTLVVNTCSWQESFNQLVSLPAGFGVHPNGNPGNPNAVFTYMTFGTPTPSTYLLFSWGTETPQGIDVCLLGRTLDSGKAMLTTTKVKAIKDYLVSGLAPSSPGFPFTSTLWSGTSCSGTMHSLADPNPATFYLPYTKK